MRVTMFLAVVLLLAVFTHFAGCSYPGNEICAKYYECSAYYDGVFDRADSFDDDAYGDGGSCWQSARTTELCEATCNMMTQAMRKGLDGVGAELGPCE